MKVLSRVFRGKFIAGLKRLYRRKQLRCAGPSAALADEKQFRQLLRRLHRQDWVVYAKPAFGGPRQVLRYLGRYTHRVAISNHRLTSFDGERVTFRWKDYAHGSQTRQMTLAATEFLRRFFLHVLPKGFVRIRHFGFLAHRFRAARVKLCRQLLAQAPSPPTPAQVPHTDAAIWHCPHCGTVMIIIQRFASGESLSRCVTLIPPRWSANPDHRRAPRTPAPWCAHVPFTPTSARPRQPSPLTLGPSAPPSLPALPPSPPFPHPRNAQLKRKKHSISIVGRARQRLPSSLLIENAPARHHPAGPKSHRAWAEAFPIKASDFQAES